MWLFVSPEVTELVPNGISTNRSPGILHHQHDCLIHNVMFRYGTETWPIPSFAGLHVANVTLPSGSGTVEVACRDIQFRPHKWLPCH
jgi:hypothetical protein